MICLFIENIGIILGAKIFDICTNIEIYKTMSIQEIILNGFSYLRAIFGAITGILIYAKLTKKSYTDLAQILFPNLILIYSILKICVFKLILEIFRQPVNIMSISISQIISIWEIIILIIWYKMFNKEEENDKSYSL